MQPALPQQGGLSGLLGVTEDEAGVWRVRLRVGGGKRLYIGRYADVATAARVYDRAAVLLLGPHTVTNFGTPAALVDGECPLSAWVQLLLLQAAPRLAVSKRRKAQDAIMTQLQSAIQREQQQVAALLQLTPPSSKSSGHASAAPSSPSCGSPLVTSPRATAAAGSWKQGAPHDAPAGGPASAAALQSLQAQLAAAKQVACRQQEAAAARNAAGAATIAAGLGSRPGGACWAAIGAAGAGMSPAQQQGMMLAAAGLGGSAASFAGSSGVGSFVASTAALGRPDSLSLHSSGSVSSDDAAAASGGGLFGGSGAAFASGLGGGGLRYLGRMDSTLTDASSVVSGSSPTGLAGGCWSGASASVDHTWSLSAPLPTLCGLGAPSPKPQAAACCFGWPPALDGAASMGAGSCGGMLLVQGDEVAPAAMWGAF